ncbi:hypothetical protein ACHWQZ_G005507 [Mnemiopsis leidyi]
MLVSVSSSQDVRLVFPPVSVEEKVCGYLRHISSNTCVGEHDDMYLTANTTNCSKEDHLFCYDANKMIITRSRDRKIISVLDPDPVSDSILVLTDKNEGEYSELTKGRNYLKIYIQQKSRFNQEVPLTEHKFHINVDFFDTLAPEKSLGVLKLHKGEKKGTFLTAVNWATSKRCSTAGDVVNNNSDSQLMVWINSTGQINVDLDGKRTDMGKCWKDPWCGPPVRIRVTGIDMKWHSNVTLKPLEDLFDIRYEILYQVQIECAELTEDRRFLKINIKEKNHFGSASVPQYRFHINVDFYNGSNPGNSLGFLKLQIKKGKDLSLTAVNWVTSERCSTDGDVVNNNSDSELMVWINSTGQINVHLDGNRADMGNCWKDPWFGPVRIRVTGIDMKRWNAAEKTKLKDMFDIHYKILEKVKSKF